MEASEHLRTHAHKTQTYWSSQANNKLIWAISALCGGTKQQDQAGAAASSLIRGLHRPILFSYPCNLSGPLSGMSIWLVADTQAEAERKMGRGPLCFKKRKDSILP